MGDASSPTAAMGMATATTTTTRHGPADLPSSNPTASFWQTSHPNRIAEYRSTQTLPAKADVVVIGTGISGTFAVDELLQPQSQPGANVEGVKGQLRPHGESGPNQTNNEKDENQDHTEILVLEARTTCSAATGRNGGHLQPVIHAETNDIVDFELRNFRHIEDLVHANKIPCDFRLVKGCIGFWNKRYFEEAKAALGMNVANEYGNATPSGAGSKDMNGNFTYEADIAAEAGTDTAAAAAPSQTSPTAVTVTVSAPPSPLPAAITTPNHRSLVRVVEDPEEIKRLGLQAGAVGAIVQDVAASLSPYKLIIWMWERMLGQFDVGRLDLQTCTTVMGIEQRKKKKTEKKNPPVSASVSPSPTGAPSTTDTATETTTSAPAPAPGPAPKDEHAEAESDDDEEEDDDDDDDYPWLIHTPRGSIAARRIIVATNGYTSHLLPQFSALISPVQAQMSALVPPPGSPFAAHSLIPMSYGFTGVGNQDRVMTDYLVQNPHLGGDDCHGNGNGNGASPTSTSTSTSTSVVGRGGHLMFGGGRNLAHGNGVGVSDDSYVEPGVELYLRSLPDRLNLYGDGKEDEIGNEDESEAIRTDNSNSNNSSNSSRTLDGHNTTDSTDTINANNNDNPSSPPSSSGLLDIAASWTGIIGSSADGHPWVGPVPPTTTLRSASTLQSGDRSPRSRGLSLLSSESNSTSATNPSPGQSTGLFLCAGYSGHGMTNAGGCGRYVAGLVKASLQQSTVGKGDHFANETTTNWTVPSKYMLTEERMAKAGILLGKMGAE
ncbi:hypothetical protein A1O1_01821 [Capronia coronata CBS 617.96]|uniref:FAD dependent oxidoreductase domain-containing protein n=1 Tax=Capronia coronata CBS 617.96 TaxID=1182541 RepID=W9ZG14_9EURO|nr:uncharacterized protein A1O1_01821 [Capronia coronata CBS 617.96]EXJ93429.1 hypothetical protein A1O1_01821 [Capronia coronata CBS 617.96]